MAILTYALFRWYYLAPILIFSVIYFLFVAYLTVYLLICLGWESLASYPLLSQLYRLENLHKAHVKPTN